MAKKIVENYFFTKKNFFCENEKLDYPRFLGDFYYHEHLIFRALESQQVFATG